MNAQIEEVAVNEQQHTAAPTSGKKRMPAAVRVILCILLAILLFVDAALIAVTTAVRYNATEEKIEELLADTDYMAIPITFDGIKSNVYEIFFFAFANKSTESVDVYELAKDTDLEEIVAEHLYSYVEFILYDKRLDGIDGDVIMDFYNDNSAEIDRAFNVTFSKNEIRKIIDEQGELFDKLSDDEIEDSIPMIDLIRFMMTPVALGILAAIAVICIVLIGILSRSAGTPLVVTGIIATIIGLAVSAASCLAIWGVIGVQLSTVTAASIIWQGVVSAVLPDIFKQFVYILTAGILLILTGGYIGQIRRNLKRAKNN